MRSMYAGVSGLKAHQTKMDVIGNNISNVNTTGYKGSRVTFQEMLSQTIEGASSPQDGRGGTNPQQIGLGVQVGSVDNNMGSGNPQSTGKMTDLAIDGEGFFIANDGNQNLYTRAGNLTFDKEGYLVNSSTGYRMQGWKANESGEINKMGGANLEDISLDKTMEASASKNANFKGNLDGSVENLLEFTPNKIQVDDGTNVGDMSVDLSKTPNYNEWDFTLTGENSSDDFIAGGSSLGNTLTGTINVDEEGNVTNLVADDGGSTIDLLAGSNDLELDVTGDGNTQTLASFGGSFDINSTPLFDGGAGETVDGDYTLNAQRDLTANVYDSQGTEHTISFTTKKTADNEWTIAPSDVSVSDATLDTTTGLGSAAHQITFDGDGDITGGDEVDITFTPDKGAGTQTVSLDFSQFTQSGGDMDAKFDIADGYSQGSLKSFTIDGSGTITGSFDNGYNKTLAKIGVASFKNPAGLSREGSTMFNISNNSGEAQIGQAGTSGRGMLTPGSLEMSNVDLSRQFTEMITAQRGFQANSKAITTSDQMLQTLVNLKR